jgi:N-acetylglucosamine repressor
MLWNCRRELRKILLESHMKNNFSNSVQSFNTMSIRVLNRQRVLQLLYENESMTQAEIINMTGQSRPTVTQTLQYFRKVGLVKEGKILASSGGRKPHAVQFCYDACHAIGVEIRKHHIDISILNLKGELITDRQHYLVFNNTREYWEKVNSYIVSAISNTSGIKRLLGVELAFPGEISLDGSVIERATVLGISNLPVAKIQQFFDYPIHVEYGASAAAYSYMFWQNESNNLVYVVVTDDGVAGSVIINHEIFHGNGGKAAAFGHICLVPGGKKCFCGGRGCWSAYCALSTLTGEEDPDLDDFFSRIKTEKKTAEAWQEYLERFAQGLANIRLSYDSDVVIGGKIVPYLEPYLQQLTAMVKSYPALADDDFKIRVDNMSSNPISEGAAKILIARFMKNELDGFHLEEL